MNSRGQSLILFVLLVPVMFLILMMVYDIGSMALLKNELDDINYMVLDYGLDHLSEEGIDSKLEKIIVKNKQDINASVSIVEDKIYVILDDNINNKLSIINKITSVKSSYIGYMEDDKKVIKKNK